MKILYTIAISIIISGCAATGLNQGDYYSRLGLVELGITKSEFREIFPESIPRGAKRYPSGVVEVLEVSYEYYSFIPTGNKNRNEMTGMEGQPQWFYFINDQLLQYGNPEDWPSEADIVIETRVR